MKRTLKALRKLVLPVYLALGLSAQSTAAESTVPAEQIRRLLSLPEERQDFLEAAVRLDQLIDPAINPQRSKAAIDALIKAAGVARTDPERFAAVRRVLYQPGPWNGGRAFAYDQSDPLGRKISNKLLSTYLETRLGNCVSMPILYLILADRLGMKVRLSAAPLHVFVRYVDAMGKAFNIETTSGGNFARDAWYRQNLPMADKAVESGAYLRTLSRRESVAEMANTLVDHLIAEQRYSEAAEVADAILEVNPKDVYAMVRKATALSERIQRDFVTKYPNPRAMPPAQREQYTRLIAEHGQMFTRAEALGWSGDEGKD